MKNRRERKMAALRDNEIKKQQIEEEKQAEKKRKQVHDGENAGTNEGEKSLEQALNEVKPCERKLEQELTRGGESELSNKYHRIKIWYKIYEFTDEMSVDLINFKRFFKYVCEGLSGCYRCFCFPRKKMNPDEILMIAAGLQQHLLLKICMLLLGVTARQVWFWIASLEISQEGRNEIINFKI